MSTREDNFGDDLFLDDIDLGTWRPSARGDSKNRSAMFPSSRGKRRRTTNRSSDEEFGEYRRGSVRANRYPRGRFARGNSYGRSKQYNIEDDKQYRGRHFSDKESPFSREDREGNNRFEDRLTERRYSRTNSGSREGSPSSEGRDGVNLMFENVNERKNLSNLDYNIEKRATTSKHEKSHSRSRSAGSISGSTSGSSSGSSRSHSSGSSSSRKNSRDRGYSSRSRRSVSNSPRQPSGERGRASSPYGSEPPIQPPGWFHTQNFTGPSSNPSGFTNLPPPQPPVYPEGGYNSNYQNQGFAGNYQQFQGYETNNTNYYPSLPQNFPPNPAPSQDYNMGGPHGPNWDGSMVYPDTSIPPPPSVLQPSAQQIGADSNAPLQPLQDQKSQDAKKEAVEQELIQQKRTLAKQREDYIRKSNSLHRELNRLKEQKRDLLQENLKDNERILRENAKLQNEIQQKLKAINNVIEMLSGIIGDNSDTTEKDNGKSSEKKKENFRSDRSNSSSPEISEIRSKAEKLNVNLVHYDPELHWCSDCNIFPRTAVDYLNHLHSEEHKQKIPVSKSEDLPWHANQPKEKTPPLNKNAPNKRIPLRGLQFLVPAKAWFCKLCDFWVGDLHCASNHLKSAEHGKNYLEYTTQNPHWEVDWLSDRTRAFERSSEHLSRLREASEAQAPTASPSQRSSNNVSLSSLSGQLLAMLTANKGGICDIKGKNKSNSSTSSNSSSSSESSDEKNAKKSKRKKKKKSKKKSKKEIDEKQEKKEHDERRQSSEYFQPDYEIPVKPFTLKRAQQSEKLDDDKIIREWMAPPDSDRELSSLKGRLKQKHESEQQKKRDEVRYREEKQRYDRRHREYRDHRDSKDSRDSKRRGDDFRDRRSPDKSKHSERDSDHRYGDEKGKPEKPHGKIWAPGKDEDDEIETNFEKRTSESAAKKKDVKKPPLMNLPKTKLPFIGRMPILKKKPSDQKPEDNVKEEKKEDNPQNLVDKKPSYIWPDLPNIPEPPITEQVPAPPMDLNQPLPKSTLIISKRPRLMEPEHSRKDSDKPKLSDDILGEQDMDIEDDTPKDELHKDFKDALELLFPGESSDKDKSEANKDGKATDAKNQDVSAHMMAHHGYMGMPPHGMMGHYMTPDAMYRADQGRYMAGQTAYDYSGYGSEQPPPPGYMPQAGHSGYMPYGPGYMVDSSGQPSYMGAPPGYPVGYSQDQPLAGVSTEPDVPPPPGLEDLDNEESGFPSSPKPSKKKNPPSQRMRRHMQKKKAREEAEKGKDEDGGSDTPSEEMKVFQPTEMSELAMLGIDEEDSTAQNFH